MNHCSSNSLSFDLGDLLRNCRFSVLVGSLIPDSRLELLAAEKFLQFVGLLVPWRDHAWAPPLAKLVPSPNRAGRRSQSPATLGAPKLEAACKSIGGQRRLKQAVAQHAGRCEKSRFAALGEFRVY